MNVKDNTRYRSEVATVWVVLAAACVFAFYVGCALSSEGAGMGSTLRSAALAVSVALVAGAVPCRYTLTPDALRLQAGFYVREIPYTDILAVTLEHGWTWAPALSANRIVLHHASGSVRISPVCQPQFLVDLARRLQGTRGSDLRLDLAASAKTQP
ncbi:PH domain-containing protein [Variovorax davisae]|uniref:PH domain-containing protein n=1 Tax=Variovorax davisae TaxID=3053515 RepID=UPI0025772F9B|nr:PH domain-containing protein [Variovorax sp. J22P271]